MINQYPDELIFKAIQAESVYDQDSGTWTIPDNTDYTIIKCRAEINGNGETVYSNDGGELKYSYIVYLDRSCPLFKYGQFVEIINSDGIIFSGTVKAFKRGQLNARLWL